MTIITEIEAFYITVPLPKPLQLGVMSIPHREYAIVRIHDSDGQTGTSFGLTRNAPIAHTIDRLITPHWVNQQIDNHETLYAKTVRTNIPMGTNGIFWRAMSLVDCALYDLLAIRDNVPLSRYLGGEPQTTPTVLVWGYPAPDETKASLQEQMQIIQEYQPAGAKIASCGDFAQDTIRLCSCREVLSDDIPLMIDLYWQITNPADLLDEAMKWSDFKMGWLEDPTHFDDFASLATLTDNLDYPVAVGDEQTGLRHFQRLIKQGGTDILRLDATVCGGVRAFIEICQMASAHNIPVACHVFHHLHANLASALPNVQWIEYMPPEAGLESINQVWEDDLEWDTNGLKTSERSGMGINWYEDKLAFYRTES